MLNPTYDKTSLLIQFYEVLCTLKYEASVGGAHRLLLMIAFFQDEIAFLLILEIRGEGIQFDIWQFSPIKKPSDIWCDLVHDDKIDLIK